MILQAVTLAGDTLGTSPKLLFSLFSLVLVHNKFNTGRFPGDLELCSNHRGRTRFGSLVKALLPIADTT